MGYMVRRDRSGSTPVANRVILASSASQRRKEEEMEPLQAEFQSYRDRMLSVVTEGE